MVVEAIVIAMAWLIQIAVVFLLAFLVAAVGKVIEECLRKRKVKWVPRVAVTFLLLCSVLAALAVNPIVVCSGEVESRLTQNIRDQVRDGAAGLYSWKIPLVPVCVEITGLEERVVEGENAQKAEFSVYYFCFGKYRMEYDSFDGYNAYPMF